MVQRGDVARCVVKEKYSQQFYNLWIVWGYQSALLIRRLEFWACAGWLRRTKAMGKKENAF